MQVAESTPAAAPPRELITDLEGAAVLAVCRSRFAALQKEPDFPRPVWLGPRGKRHVRSELIGWAMARREVKK